jgi:hypothetical protein
MKGQPWWTTAAGDDDRMMVLVLVWFGFASFFGVRVGQMMLDPNGSRTGSMGLAGGCCCLGSFAGVRLRLLMLEKRLLARLNRNLSPSN